MKGQADYEGVDMPKVTGVTIAVTALMLIALTGCAGGTDSSGDERTAPAVSESAAPLVAESTSPTEELGTEGAYLEDVRTALEANGGSSIPNATDDQLLAAGADACEQMRSGTELKEVRVVEGEQPTEIGYVASGLIAGGAAKHLCPDMDMG